MPAIFTMQTWIWTKCNAAPQGLYATKVFITMVDPANKNVSQFDSACAVTTLHALCFISILHFIFQVVLLSTNVDLYCFFCTSSWTPYNGGPVLYYQQYFQSSYCLHTCGWCHYFVRTSNMLPKTCQNRMNIWKKRVSVQILVWELINKELEKLEVMTVIYLSCRESLICLCIPTIISHLPTHTSAYPQMKRVI